MWVFRENEFDEWDVNYLWEQINCFMSIPFFPCVSMEQIEFEQKMCVIELTLRILTNHKFNTSEKLFDYVRNKWMDQIMITINMIRTNNIPS